MNLTSILVAIGIAGIFALSFAGVTRFHASSEKNSEEKFDRIQLRQTLILNTRCDELQGFSGCNPGDILNITGIKPNGSTYTAFSNTGATKVGKIVLRAECNATGDGFLVKGAKLRPSKSISSSNSSDFFPEPRGGEVVTWSSTKSLLFGNIDFCTAPRSTVEMTNPIYYQLTARQGSDHQTQLAGNCGRSQRTWSTNGVSVCFVRVEGLAGEYHDCRLSNTGAQWVLDSQSCFYHDPGVQHSWCGAMCFPDQ